MKSLFVRREEAEVGLIMVGQSEGQKIKNAKMLCGLLVCDTLLPPLVPCPIIFTLVLDKQL